MLLRSVITHVRMQNWTAILIDLLIVVFGVFIGIQVANWNEDRMARQRERIYLTELRSDFNSILERSESGMAMYENNVAVIRVFRECIQVLQQGDDSRDWQPIAADMSEMMAGRVPAGRSPFYAEMMASGQLAVLGNRDLRRELAAYDDASRIGSEGFRVLRDQLLPALYHTLRYSNAEVDFNPDTERELITASGDITGFLKDPETPGMLSIAMSVFGNMHKLHRSQADRAHIILRLIDLELEQP